MLQILASSSPPSFIDSVSSARIRRFSREFFVLFDRFHPFAPYLFISSFFLPLFSLLLQSIPVFRITFYTQLLFIKAIRRLEYIDRTVTRVHYHPENHGCSCRVRTKKRERKKKAMRMEIKNDRRGTGRLAIPTVFKRYQFLATILTSRRKSFTSCIFHFRSKIKYHWKGLS